MKKTYPYTRQHIEEEDISAVLKVLRSDWLTTGPEVDAFERDFCTRTGSQAAVAVANGTAALHAACFAAGFGPGDEVLVPSCTFLSTANAVCFVGATPKFVDIVPESLTMDVDKAAALVGPRTKGIIPVHFGGVAADLAAIRELADRHDLTIIEDACHAPGASYRDAPVGDCRFGHMAAFSFHPTKQITAAEGGMVTVNDDRLAARLKQFRNHGSVRSPEELERNEGPWWYEMQDLGFNYRLSDLHAALGRSQLGRLDRFVTYRRKLSALYRKLLAGHDLVLGFQEEPDYATSACHLMLVRIDFERSSLSRAEYMAALKRRGVNAAVHYIPVNRHPWYQRSFSDQTGATPLTDEYYRQCLTIPLSTLMEEEDVNYVAGCLLEELK